MDRSLKWAVAIVITLILVLSPVFSQGCGATKWNPKGGNGQDTMLTLTRTDNGKSITMQVNDLLLLSLDENPTTGFQWALDGGGGGQRVLTFKAQRAGIGQLKLKLWREWQGEPSIVERFTVTLQVRE